MKINKSKLMKKAWRIARKAVQNFGGTIREYFSASLKEAWRLLKSRYVDVDGLKRIADKVKESKLCDETTLYFDDVEIKMAHRTRIATVKYLVNMEVWDFPEWLRSTEVKNTVKNNIMALI